MTRIVTDSIANKTPSWLSVESEEFALSVDEIAEYHKKGYIGPFRAFEPQAMPEIRKRCESIIGCPSLKTTYQHRLRHLDSKTVFDLCTHPRIVSCMRSLHGPDLLLWLATFFDKPPSKPGEIDTIPWHADAHHWNHEPLIMCTAWLAITDATVENGCIEVIPGSHKTITPTTHSNDTRFDQAGITADPAWVDVARAVPLPMKAGEFILFDQNLLHGSGANRTIDRRIGLAIRTTLPSVKIKNQENPSILVSGQDHFGINQLTEPPTSDPNLEALRKMLPESPHYSFDQQLLGAGWHLPVSEGGRAYRWTGPGTESWIELKTQSGGAHHMRCNILHGIEADTVGGLSVFANEELLPLSFIAQPKGLAIEAIIPKSVIARGGEVVRLTFRVPRTLRPCDIDRESVDVRPLGIAVSSITLNQADE